MTTEEYIKLVDTDILIWSIGKKFDEYKIPGCIRKELKLRFKANLIPIEHKLKVLMFIGDDI